MDLPEPYEWSDEELTTLGNLSLTRVQPLVRPRYCRHYGCSLTATYKEYYEIVWLCENDNGGRFVVKSMAKDSLEVKALQHIWSLPSPRNIAVPGRLLECSDRCMQLMPSFRKTFGALPDFVSWDQFSTLR